MRRKHVARHLEETDADFPEDAESEPRDADLTPLFRLLARQPAPDHDYRTCPICQQYGIADI